MSSPAVNLAEGESKSCESFCKAILPELRLLLESFTAHEKKWQGMKELKAGTYTTSSGLKWYLIFWSSWHQISLVTCGNQACVSQKCTAEQKNPNLKIFISVDADNHFPMFFSLVNWEEYLRIVIIASHMIKVRKVKEFWATLITRFNCLSNTKEDAAMQTMHGTSVLCNSSFLTMSRAFPSQMGVSSSNLVWLIQHRNWNFCLSSLKTRH